VLVLALFSHPAFAQTDTIRIAAYNLLFFDGGVDAQSREPAFHKVLAALNPDVLVVCEMNTQVAVDRFHDRVLNRNDYARTDYMASADRDVVCYFRKGLFEHVSTKIVPTINRDVMTFGLRYLKDPNAPILYVSGIHLKAGNEFAADRVTEATQYVSMVIQERRDDYVLLCGDLNTYSSTEGAYQLLLADSLFYDPVSSPGVWHDDSTFTRLHTQSTRYIKIGEGSDGGLDDRFDFILASRRFNRPAKSGWSLLPGSYWAYGQDGKHFNQDLTWRNNPNISLPDSVLTALRAATDHLPITVQLLFKHPTDDVRTGAVVPGSPQLLNAYPNPFNGSVQLSLELERETECNLSIFSLGGQLVDTLVDGRLEAGGHQLQWNAQGVVSGVYLAVLTAGNTSLLKKVTVVR
jgi:endonuclease/exonuclease/phosphatase family metal-dependent hydrolase